MKVRHILIAAALLAVGVAAMAHGGAGHGMAQAGAVKKEQKAWGIAGEPKSAGRTIKVRMSDAMRFTPERIEVRQGETIRFVHRNDGKVMHEFVLGTQAALDEHAAMMEKFPDMEHDEPYMAHVAPGGTAEMVWTFNRPGRFGFACLIPGHYQAGMKGTVVVRAAK